MALKINYGFSKIYEILIVLLFTIIPLYYRNPFILIAFIVVYSLIIAYNNDLHRATYFFIILSLLLPYSFVSFSGYDFGKYFNEYFFAGIPLYLFLPKYLLTTSSLMSNTHKFVIAFLFLLFTITNIIPGLLSALGLGGGNVRLILIFNYLNALLLMLYLSKIEINKKFIFEFSHLMISLGTILSVIGIFQYVSNVSVVPNYKPQSYDLSRLFVLSSINSVACFPALIVPYSFAISKVSFQKRSSFTIVSLLIIGIAIFLTWSRLAWVILFFVSAYTLFIKKKYALTIFLSVILIPILFSLFSYGIEERNQADRVKSFGSLYTRFYLWELGITAIFEKPWFGYGFGNQVNAMFAQESSYPLFTTGDMFSVTTFQQQSVHQYFIDNMLAQGILFAPVMIFILVRIIKYSLNYSRGPNKLYNGFYFAILCATSALIIFWIQNVGIQTFYIFGFFGLVRK